MILRLMGSCNNRCRMCLVSEEIAGGTFVDPDKAAMALDAIPPDEEVDIFGGEPTLDPAFLYIIEKATNGKRRVGLASNVRAFASMELVQAVRRINPELAVRTSLHGDCAETHDYISGSRGAFIETIQGIRNLALSGFTVSAATVVLEPNVHKLAAVADTALEAGADRIKYISPVKGERFLNLLADPRVSSKRIEETHRVLTGRGVQVHYEKFHLCALPGQLRYTLPLSTAGVIETEFRARCEQCTVCAMSSVCPGMDESIFSRYGGDSITAFREIPADLHVRLPASDINNFVKSRPGRKFITLCIPETYDAAETLYTVIASKKMLWEHATFSEIAAVAGSSLNSLDCNPVT